MVNTKNNLAMEYEWCYPCNQQHNQSTCSNGLMNQALIVQGTSSSQPTSNIDVERQLEVPPIYATFMNQKEEEYCGVNKDNTTIGVYTRSKKRALDNDVGINKDMSVENPSSLQEQREQQINPLVATQEQSQ